MKGALLVILVILIAGCASSIDSADVSESIQLTFYEGEDEDPSILQSIEGDFFVVWFSQRSGNADIWIKSSTDAISWSEARPVIQGGGENFHPSLTQTSDGTFHLTWFRIDSSRVSNIFYSKSADSVVWSEPVQLTNKSGIDWVPSIAKDDEDKLWIVWSSDRRGSKDIFLKRSEDNGETWNLTVRLTFDDTQEDYPSFTQMPDRTYLVTFNQDDKDLHDLTEHPTSKIMYTGSADAIDWIEPQVLIDEAKSVDTYPFVYSVGGDNYVAWTSSQTDGYGDILYLKFPDGEASRLTTMKGRDYFPRVHHEGAGSIMAWVSDKSGNLDIFVQRFEN